MWTRIPRDVRFCVPQSSTHCPISIYTSSTFVGVHGIAYGWWMITCMRLQQQCGGWWRYLMTLERKSVVLQGKVMSTMRGPTIIKKFGCWRLVAVWLGLMDPTFDTCTKGGPFYVRFTKVALLLSSRKKNEEENCKLDDERRCWKVNRKLISCKSGVIL